MLTDLNQLTFLDAPWQNDVTDETDNLNKSTGRPKTELLVRLNYFNFIAHIKESCDKQAKTWYNCYQSWQVTQKM